MSCVLSVPLTYHDAITTPHLSWNCTNNLATSTIAYIENHHASNLTVLALISESISSTLLSSSIWTTAWGAAISCVLIVTLIGFVGSISSHSL